MPAAPATRARAARWCAWLAPVALLGLWACQGAAEDEASGPSVDEPELDRSAPVDVSSLDLEAGGANDLPERPPDPTASRVDEWVDGLDDDGLLGQLLMLRVYGGDVDESDARNQRLYGVDTPREVVETYRPGGILLFRSDGGEDTGNLRDPEQVRAFTNDLREVSGELGPPLVVAVDQEGGVVDRIGHFGTPYPTARDLEEDPDAAREHADTTVRELAALGIDMNFAPVADVDSEATNPIIGDRAYSEDPEIVARMVLAQLERYRDGPVVPVLKHFPGHGATTADSHLTLPTVDADLELLARRELVPFAEAVDAGARAIMTAHLELPEVSGEGVPTSMSQTVITGLLRGTLGFDGLIVTDSLEMAGARQDRADDRVALHALLAGHDLLVLPPRPAETLATLDRAIDSEQLPRQRVDDSVRRLLALKADLELAAQDDADRPAPDVVGDATDDAAPRD